MDIATHLFVRGFDLNYECEFFFLLGMFYPKWGPYALHIGMLTWFVTFVTFMNVVCNFHEN